MSSVLFQVCWNCTLTYNLFAIHIKSLTFFDNSNDVSIIINNWSFYYRKNRNIKIAVLYVNTFLCFSSVMSYISKTVYVRSHFFVAVRNLSIFFMLQWYWTRCIGLIGQIKSFDLTIAVKMSRNFDNINCITAIISLR